MGKSTYSELCAPTASWGTSVQAYAYGIPCRYKRGNALNQSKHQSVLGGYHGKNKACKLKAQLFRTVIQNQNLCNLNLGSSISFTLTFHSCKNCRLPCVHISPESTQLRKFPFSCSWGAISNRMYPQSEASPASPARTSFKTSKDRFFPESLICLSQDEFFPPHF